MTPQQKQWIFQTANAALEGGHAFATMAACEAALESAYGESELAKVGLNLFGLKQRTHPVYGTLVFPTKEYLDGQWKTIESAFVSYPSLADCFADRMATLTRLRDVYPHYEAALTAPDPQTFVTEVSKSWSTDPARAAKVIAIYNEAFPDHTGPR